jgi:hypothetical protein
MTEKNVVTLSVIIGLPPNRQRTFLQTCDCTFIRFQVLNNPSVIAKGSQLSVLQRHAQNTWKQDDELSKQSIAKSIKDQILHDISTLKEPQIRKSEVILEKILNDKHLSIDHSGQILFDNTETGTSGSTFLYALQQPKKQLSDVDKFIISHLNLPEHLAANTHVKNVIKESGWTYFTK